MVTRKYRITNNNYKNKSWLWDPVMEIHLSLFVKRLCEIRPNLKYNKVVKEIMEKYIRIKKNGIVNPTQIMRHVINKK